MWLESTWWCWCEFLHNNCRSTIYSASSCCFHIPKPSFSSTFFTYLLVLFLELNWFIRNVKTSINSMYKMFCTNQRVNKCNRPTALFFSSIPNRFRHSSHIALLLWFLSNCCCSIVVIVSVLYWKFYGNFIRILCMRRLRYKPEDTE